jgi:hypothetical protein
MFRGKVNWSPVEADYLKANRDKLPINQLTIALSKSRNAIKKKLDEFDGKITTINRNKRSYIGKREDLNNQFMRSRWEANVARWLNHKKKDWKYEPEVFFFEGVKHGTVSYLPDFKVGTLWLEVKGQLDPKGKTAVRRFKKFYPKEFKKLRAVVGRPGTQADNFFTEIGVPIMAYYNELDRRYKDKISHWE